MVREEGKPLADARNESGRTPKNLELYAGEAYRLSGATFPSDDTPLVYSTRDPVGGSPSGPALSVPTRCIVWAA